MNNTISISFHAGKFIVALILFLIIIFHAMLKILFLGKNKSKDIIIIKIIIILGVGGQKRWQLLVAKKVAF